MTPSRVFPWVLALVLLAVGLALGLQSKAQAQPPVSHPVSGREQCLLCHGPGGVKPAPADHAGRPVSTCLACHAVAIASPTATPPAPTSTATPPASPTVELAPGEATPLPPTPTATATPTPSPTPEPTPLGGNQLCLACHQSPGLSFTLPSGEQVSAQVDPAAFEASVHRRFQCSYCHEDKTGYPHSKVAEPDFRTYRAARAGLCADCHGQALVQWQTSAHGRAQAAGNQQAALCSDCHDAHQTLPLTLPKAQITPCAACHPAVTESYWGSAHGRLVAQGGAGAATCASCHSADGRNHTLQAIADAPDANSPVVCGRCHAKALETYETTMHGRAWRLGRSDKAPTCVDCHGSYGVQPVHGSEVTLTSEKMAGTCATCHPGADVNFASGWLGHEEPSRRHFPWVYVTERFLFYLTTSVIAFGIVHVELDLLRWWVNKRRKKV